MSDDVSSILERSRDMEREAATAVLAGCDSSAGLPALTSALQLALGYVPPAAVPLLADRIGAERSCIFEFVNSSAQLSFTRCELHRVAICLGRNCSRRGASDLAEEAKRLLGVDTLPGTADFGVRLEPFYCFGRCQHGPNILVDGQIHRAMTLGRLRELLHDLPRAD